MIWWHVVLVLAGWGGLCAGLGWASGEAKRNRLRDDAEAAYNNGWDDSALAHSSAGGQADALTAELSTGRGAAGDGPASLPAPPMIDPDCRDGKHGSCIGGPCECPRHRAGDDDWYTTTMRELAPEAERPASHTDQFRAVFSRADGLERQCLLTWDTTRRYDRDRPQYLRDMGVSEQRIRELLGAE